MAMPKRLIALMALATLLVATGVAVAAPAGDPHYPDLRTTRKYLARDLRIVHEGGRKLLRFSNNVRNDGDGPLELRPENDPVTNTTDAYQRVYSHDEDGSWYLDSEIKVGTFAFHEAHNHWHFADFAGYYLHEVTSRGWLGPLIGEGSKVTFCIADVVRIDSTLEHSASTAAYPVSNCDQNSTTGLSVGWGDTYKYSLADQSIDITGLPDGRYWLVSTADPDNRLLETNDANNSTKLKIEIRRDRVVNLTS